MIELRLRFQTVTPMFLGNAGQQAELRAPSIKGALRWWYRAIDPEFASPDRPDREIDDRRDQLQQLPLREDLLFGGM